MMECRDQETELAQTLSLLVPAAVEGLVNDVVVLDHGSRDGSSRVADAAGCRFHVEWNIKDILGDVRGDWLLLLEPGARLQTGWIDEIIEYVALNRRPVRFAPSRAHRPPFFQRIGRALPPLECGLLIEKKQAITFVKSGMDLAALAKGHKAGKLKSEMIPARAASVR